ncbi:MAG TPA: hypothetical protein VNQ15_01085, partial [Verrucomicrobiae bacterium]|nr:hypothetical protein [Verrucomicrobiae bacterium]
MTNPVDNEPDETGHLLRGALPRWPAPARLRRAVMEALNPVEARSRPSLWLPPALAALAAAMVMVLWLAPALRRETGDQIEYLSRAAISEHARAVLWSDTRPDLLPAALPRVMEESGVTLNWVFTGDDDLQLIGAVPVVVEGRRGMSLVYRDRDGHTVVYVIASGPIVAIPERGRVQIERWRPLLRKESDGF